MKARTVTITLGNIAINAYMLPNGQLFLSLTQVAESIDMPLKRMSQLRELNIAQSVIPQGLESRKCKVEEGTKPVNTISVTDACAYWTLAASTGNKNALLLVAALATENIERRAYPLFGVVVPEAEYAEKMAVRLAGIENFSGE